MTVQQEGKPRIVILGAGPAGLGAAFRLAQRGIGKVTVLERNGRVGGNAGSFDLFGFCVDYGSHRLHPSCDSKILGDIRNFLKDDLLDRPRHGRIKLCGRWIHFPLKPIDLALRLPPKFSLGVGLDILHKSFRNRQRLDHKETFGSVLEKGLGRTICENFYFPYVQKVWGLGPDELAVTLARRRVSAGSLTKMIGKVFAAISGSKTNASGRFFYPRHGYGQISESYYRAACMHGAEVHLDSRVQTIETQSGAVRSVQYEKGDRSFSIRADHVFSTIPITILARCLRPSVPAEILHAAESIHYRAMILIYLLLEQERFSEYDAHYFPESNVPISRLSEPKNYSNGEGPKNRTVLCAELPCAADGPEWNQSDDELARLVCNSLSTVGIPVQVPVAQVVTRRLRQAYPVYRRGYENNFDQLDQWLSQISGLLTFGRQGLFAHDNTHHALYMAYAASDCLQPNGRFDGAQWQAFRRVFETHVVED